LLRKPAVAGYFYEDNPEKLRKQIKSCFLHTLGPGELPVVNTQGPRKIIGLISPHAGYLYSGPVAAYGFLELSKDGVIDYVVIIGPNHHGIGAPVSIYPGGYWETPLGRIKVPENVVKEFIRTSSILEEDYEAHVYEHSIEVQLPFLQYIYGNTFNLIPISMLLQNPSAASDIGQTIATVLDNKNFVVIASSDFSHYVPYNTAYQKDREAINAILKKNPRLLYRRVLELDISMCGYGPVMALLYTLKYLGLKSEGKLLKYLTSGDVTGDKTSVVGYSSIVFSREEEA